VANITLLNGFAGLQLQPGEKTVYQRNGIAERTSIYLSCGYPSFVPIPLVTAYPSQNTGGFVCDKTEILSLPGGFYRVTVTWVSIYAPNVTYVTYDSKMIQVPVDQLPTFVSDIGGTPTAPLNDAVFDTNGVFIGFGPGSIYLGVVSGWLAQNLMIVHGSGTSQGVASDQYFLESAVQTFRGAVWEWEFTYNLDIDINTGLSTTTDVSGG
jgi:hypothetical protein